MLNSIFGLNVDLVSTINIALVSCYHVSSDTQEGDHRRAHVYLKLICLSI